MTECRTHAKNSARESDNRIHDDEVAARYGFRGGLVPGVNVFGYMTVPVVSHFGRAWLERGRMEAKFIAPFYESEQVIVRSQFEGDKISLTAEGEDSIIRARGTASLHDLAPLASNPKNHPLPQQRPQVVDGGQALGIIREHVAARQTRLLETLNDPLPVYRDALHPAVLLALANEILVRNFELSPWIHAASEITNWSLASPTEEITVRGSVMDCFELKGHQFTVLDLLLTGESERILSRVLHTAIWKFRQP